MNTTEADKSTEALVSLISPLGNVPEDKFRRVVCMLETMRHKPEVKAALDGMRERIAQVRPPRSLSVQRIMYFPVEDALVNVPDKDGSGYVSRQAMAIAWSYLEKHTDPNVISEWQRRINAVSPADQEESTALSLEIWCWAADSLKIIVDKALVDRTERKALLGDALDLLMELQQATRFLDVAPQIVALKEILPIKPLRSLDRRDKASIRHLILDLKPTNVDRVYAVLLSVMLRLAVPGEFLEEVPGIISGLPNALKAEVQARLTVFVMGDMDRRVAVAINSNTGDLNVRAQKAEILVAALSAGEKTIVTGDRDTRKQLTAVRATAEKLVSSIVAEAGNAVHDGIKSGATADIPALKRAEDSLSALRQCGTFAVKIGLEGTVKGTIETVADVMRGRAASALGALEDSDSEVYKDEIFWAIRMLELTGHADEADGIRRAAMRLLVAWTSTLVDPGGSWPAT